jgi:excisionase family DNA binding protein
MTEMTDKQTKPRGKDFLTTTEAAKLLSVSPDTVLKWVRAGKVKSHRTLGGHFRIPLSELDIPDTIEKTAANIPAPIPRPAVHQYCWQYLAGEGEISPKCKDCITFRSRAQRCYELKELPGGFGCLNLMCDTNCLECDYYNLVHGEKPKVLILSENKRLIKDDDKSEWSNGFDVRFVRSEYDAAVLIQDFRPDYIVVDCSFGQQKTTAICDHLFNDIRIPVVRIILSSKTREIEDYCDRDVFAWLQRPFAISQLLECIEGISSPANNHH